jgi:hypothetical protein
MNGAPPPSKNQAPGRLPRGLGLSFIGFFVSAVFLCFGQGESRADSVIVNFPAALVGEASTGFATSTGGSLASNLVRIGAFDTDPSSLMAGVAALTTPSSVLSNLNSRFTQYTSFTFSNDYLNPATAIFPATDAEGIPLEAQPGIGTSLQGKDIYLLFYNAATANAATEVAIFRMKQELLLDDPSGSTGVFSTGTGGDGQRTATFNLSVVETDLLLGFYNPQTDTFLTADLNGGAAQITSVLAQTNTAGSAVSYQILANNGADRFFATTNTSGMELTETNLPAGFSVSTNTGILSVATNAAAGTYPIRLVASNSLTASVATNTLTLVLQAAALTFTNTTNLISATAGVEISPFTFVSTGTTPNYSVASGNLRGLFLSTNGTLSGIPTSVGTNDVTIQSFAGGEPGSTTFSLAVTAPTIEVPGGDLTGGQLVVTAGTARTSSVTKTANFTNLTSTVEPAMTGVSFDGTSLIIATNAQPLPKGTTNVTLTLTVTRVGTSVSASTTIPLRIVAPSPTALLGTNEFEVDVGQFFSTSILTDVGSFAQMSFSNLPPGLAGFADGTVAGTNNSTNLPFEFVVPVRADSTIDYEGGGVFTSSVTMRLRNTNAPYFSLATNRHLAGVGRAITPITLTASNLPFQFTASNLPSGLQLVGANISGTPATAGTFSVPVSAYNSFRPGSTNPADWQTGTGTLIFHVADARPPASVAPSAPGALPRNSTISTNDNVFLIPGGAEAAGIRVAAFGLPPGLSLDPISGKLYGITGGSGTYNATVFIQNGRGWIKKAVTLTVQ